MLRHATRLASVCSKRAASSILLENATAAKAVTFGAAAAAAAAAAAGEVGGGRWSILQQHAVHSSAGAHQQGGAGSGSSSSSARDLDRAAVVRRMLYRSKQRGFLELDLLVGLWAERHAATMDDATVADLEALLDAENPDLFKWLTGQEAAPRELAAGNRAFKSMYADVQSRLKQHSPTGTRAGPGAQWSNGWQDIKNRGEVPKGGNFEAAQAAVEGGGAAAAPPKQQ